MVSVSSLETQLAFSVVENKGVFAVLIGSGVSRAAQIPTGWEITIDLIRRVAQAQGAGEQADWDAWYRESAGQAPNYSALLEELASSPEERRSILHSYIEPNEQEREERKKVPTEAHLAIADMVANGYIRVIITTNFDRLMENALRERGIEPTIISSTDALAGAEPLVHSACYVVKLHGDYKDTRILNTEAELESYPLRFNDLLDRIFDEYGLIVCGWSAEWDHALRSAILRAPNRRYSVFWAARGELGNGAKELVNHRKGRVIQIADANSFFKQVGELVRTLEETRRQDPLSTELLVNSVKRYLPRQDMRIQLDELFARETERLIRTLDGENFTTKGSWTIELHRLRIKQFEAATEPMAKMIGALGRWGGDNELTIVNDVLRSLVVQANSQRAGINLYLDMRTYPAVLILTAYGLGLTRGERWSQLCGFLTADTLPGNDHLPHSPVETLFLWNWHGGDHDLWNKVIDPTQRAYTPLSNWLFDRFRDWGKSFLGAPPDYELLFDRFEMLAAVAAFNRRPLEELKKDLDVPGRVFIAAPIGRFGWNSRTRTQLFAELQTNAAVQPLLAAGFFKNNRARIDLFMQHLQKFRLW